MAHDLVHNLKVTPAYAGGTISSDTTTSGGIVIDTLGYSAVMFAIYSGAITDGTYTPKITECDNADGTTGAAEVTAYQIKQTFAAADDSAVKVCGAKITKRYCVLSLVSASTTSGGVFKGAVAILGEKDRPPAVSA